MDKLETIIKETAACILGVDYGAADRTARVEAYVHAGIVRVVMLTIHEQQEGLNRRHAREFAKHLRKGKT